MSEWFDSQKKTNGDIRNMLQERIEKANPRRELNADETKRLAKLEAIADKLKRGDIRLARKQSVKLAVVERAMYNIVRDAAPTSKDDVSKLDKFLNVDD